MKRGIIYDGVLDSSQAYQWYIDVKELLTQDGITVTHMSLSSEKINSSRICLISRVEKRYLNSILSGDNVEAIDIYSVQKGVRYLSNDSDCSCFFKNYKSFVDSFICFVFNFCILDKINLDTYDELAKKYTDWKTKTIFTMDENKDVIGSYVFMRNPQAYKSLVIEEIIKR